MNPELLTGNPLSSQVCSDLCDACSFLIESNSHNRISKSSRVLSAFPSMPHLHPLKQQPAPFLSTSATRKWWHHALHGLSFKRTSGSLPFLVLLYTLSLLPLAPMLKRCTANLDVPCDKCALWMQIQPNKVVFRLSIESKGILLSSCDLWTMKRSHG